MNTPPVIEVEGINLFQNGHPVLEDVRLRPTRVSFSATRATGWDTKWDFASGDTVQTRGTETRRLNLDGSATFNFWKGQSSSYSLAVTRDLLFPWEDPAIPFNVGREIGRNQNISLSQEINLFEYLKPRLSYDVQYSASRLAPHTATGTDSLGRPDVGVTNTKRLNLRVGLVHSIRALARLRDERLDEEAEPGSPRWILMKLDRYSESIPFFVESLRIERNSWDTMINVGFAHDKIGEYEIAEKYYKLANQLKPKTPLIQLCLANNQSLMGKKFIANQFIDNFISYVGEENLSIYLRSLENQKFTPELPLDELIPKIMTQLNNRFFKIQEISESVLESYNHKTKK